MGETLILTSTKGRALTDKMVDGWFDANEMHVAKKIFSADRRSVEVTFVDEERAEMMSDLLTTCHGDSITISRPETLATPLDQAFDEDRPPSPVHLSSSASISSFSQRLVPADNGRDDGKIKLAVGRGRGVNTDFSRRNNFFGHGQAPSVDDDTVSVSNSTISSVFGRGGPLK